MAAASTPASNVGTVGVVLAEALMAMAMTQIIRPGSPMLFGVPAMTVALNSGAPVHGSPDSAMVQFLANAMARFYRLPHRAILNVATSKSGDMQSAYDSMWGLFPAMLSGADWLTMGGGMLEGALTVGYGKTMIDFEQLDAFYHFLQGPKFDDLEEILDMVKRIGPGGHFLGETHTLNSDLFIFESQHNNSYEQWDADGRLDSEAVGVRKAQKWLRKYQPPPIDAALDEALREFIARREREIPAG
jgi:trimethylamine--corrinoid protein Co-methyltransferase